MNEIILQCLTKNLGGFVKKCGLCASATDSLSKGSMKNLIHGLVVDMPKPEVKNKKKVRILHINADHVAARFWSVSSGYTSKYD